MIVSDVNIRVRRTFGDESAVQVTDDDIIRWINDAQIEIVKNNDGALQKTGLVDLVANQSQYTMPTDMLILRALRWKYATVQSFATLKYLSMQQFDESIDGWDGTLYSTGCPVFFTVFENKAMLFPIPDQSNVGGLKVLYNQKPTDVVTNTDPLALPLIYHNTIVKYCLAQASLLDEDHDPAVLYMTNFADDMQKLATRETQEAIATYPTITTRDWDM